MGIVSEACKEQIRSRVPLEELLREYNVNLVPAGRRLRALCPFHAEKTPSFYVDVEKQFYHCFGCQESGDLFRFVQRMHQMDFPDAMELLARRAGVTLDYVGGSHPHRQSEGLVALYDAHQLARDFYHRFLMEDPAAEIARQYLRGRGIREALWEIFHLGYSPCDWDAFLRVAAQQKIPAEIAERAGLARRRERGGHYDYFRGRVMFPIADAQGRVTGFGARTLGDDVPKYLNTPKTPIFDKSQVLYALPQARSGIQRERQVAIVEGYTDAIMAHQAGLDFFVASLGTAFTAENARRLGRLAPRAQLIFDGDAAGQKATERSLDLLVCENLEVRIYTVKDGKDPCDAIVALGGEEFRRRVDRDSVGIFEFKWRRTMESEEARTGGPAIRARALDEFLDLLLRVPNVVARRLYLREFSEKLGIPESDIEVRMKQLARSGSHGRASLAAPISGPSGVAAGEVRAVAPGLQAGGGSRAPCPVREGNREIEEVILECLLALPESAGEILSAVPGDFFQSSVIRGVWERVRGAVGSGSFSPTRFLQEAEDPDAVQLLSRLWSRLEDERGNPSCDYWEVWERVQRDLRRLLNKGRADELRRLMDLEASRGVSEPGVSDALAALRREYFDTMRMLKRGGAGP